MGFQKSRSRLFALSDPEKDCASAHVSNTWQCACAQCVTIADNCGCLRGGKGRHQGENERWWLCGSEE